MSSREKHRRMPSNEKIFDYWKHREQRFNKTKFIDGIYERCCFACGSMLFLQRAHIIPVCFGGDNSEENIHLLCRICHVESEGLRVYWTWLFWKRENEFNDPFSHILNFVKKCGISADIALNNEKILSELYWI